MLTLNRKPGEAIFVDNDVEFRILAVRPDGSVNVGVTAPQNRKILREELLDKNKKGNSK